MDLRAITDLDGARLQSVTWDPGVPLPQRQNDAPSPAPPSTPVDVPTRHKHRGERYRVARNKSFDAEQGVAHGVGTNHGNQAEVPFVPRPAPHPQFHHPSDPHTARLAPLSDLHAASSATRIAAHPTYHVHSDHDSDRGTSTSTTPSPQMARRRAQPDNGDDDEGGRAEERERYRPRPRRSGAERGISLKLSPPHLPPKLTPRRPSSPQFPQSPGSDSASPQPPTQPEPAAHSNPGRYLGSDYSRIQLAHPQQCDEATTPTRGEYHRSGMLVHPQIPDVAHARSSSVESVDDWARSPTPPLLKKATMPPVSPASASASTLASAPAQAAPDAGSSGMLSDSELADETVHLRALLGSPPGAPVGLNALADPPPGEKPNYPLPTLIKLAIYGSPRGRLTLQEIYQALEDRFEWFRQRTDELSWKNSIRHNLSLRKCFLKVQRPITEPGKGSYWMIDLTQGEGNKRVRKRNKKPTKGQLAAQAAAEAYRASARLPGQGDGPRPTPYPRASQSHTRSQVVEADPDDDQAPPMQTDFSTAAPAEEPHHTLSQNSALRHPGPSPRQRQPPERLYQSPPPSADHAPLSLHQNSAQPLLSSHTILELDANIDPALRVPSKDDLNHAIAGSITELHYGIRPRRSPRAVQLPMPVNMSAAPLLRGQSVAGSSQIQQPASANLQAQMVTTHPSLAPPYNHSLLPHPGPGLQPSQVVSALHIPQHAQSLLQQQHLQPPNVHRQTVAVQQTAPAQDQTPRLPPMRTLSESLAPSQQPPSSSGGNGRSQQNTVAGFGGFAHASAGFTKPIFGKPAVPAVPLSMPMRPLSLSEVVRDANKGKRRADSHAAGDQAGDDGQRGSGRRHFAPPPPRPEFEHVKLTGEGLVGARRTSGRHDEITVDWIRRLAGGEESQGVAAGVPSPERDVS